VTDPISKHALSALRALNGTDLANAIECFDRRLRNEGFADASIRCLLADSRPSIGYAVTARIRCSSPPPVGHRYHDRTDWWNFIVGFQAPRIVVVQDVDERVGFGAFVGDLHAAILQALGCVAYVTNGAVRDTDAVGATGFRMFASHVGVSHAFARILDFGGPVEIGGLPVATGDLLFGDAGGVLSVPDAIAGDIPGAAADMLNTEKEVIAFCRSPRFSIERLRELVRGLE